MKLRKLVKKLMSKTEAPVVIDVIGKAVEVKHRDDGFVDPEMEIPNRSATKESSSKKTNKNEGNISVFQTQFLNSENSSRRQQLVIGLDFGTAFTKVVIAETRVGYAVPFVDHTSSENIFLLPGVLSIAENGECFLGNCDKAARRITELKMRLLQGDFSVACQSEISAFLALVLRHSRAWLFKTHKSTYGGTRLDWNVNVGLPTHNYHDNVLTKVYREIVEAAWFASIVSGPVTIELVEKVIKGQRGENGIDYQEYGGDRIEERTLHPDSIGLFPEFVAQVTGYVRSPLRQPDLHALVDVGAGTVDVTVFNVHEHDGEDKYPIFAKSVKPLGVQFLMLHRLRESKYDGEWKPDAQEIPPSDSEFANKLGITEAMMRNQVDLSFQQKLTQQIFGQFDHTKSNRYPKSSRWTTGVPLFWCGGGAKAEFYTRLFRLIEGTGWYPINRAFLPRPERLQAEGLAEDEYNRLSVAYGLSYDQFDIGEIIKTSEIEDIQDKNHAGGFCPTCNGTGGLRGNDCRVCGGSGLIN